MDFILIWLLFGFIGDIFLFFSEKLPFKKRIREFNYPIAFCAIIGGLITFFFGIFMFLYMLSENNWGDEDELER